MVRHGVVSSHRGALYSDIEPRTDEAEGGGQGGILNRKRMEMETETETEMEMARFLCRAKLIL